MLTLTKFESAVLAAALCARLLSNRLFTLVPVMYATARRPRRHSTATDHRNYFLLTTIFIVYNCIVAYAFCTVLLDAECLLRYLLLAPMVPVYFMNDRDRTVCPTNRLSPQLIVIRLMWDPPILLSCYLVHRLFGDRLLHDGRRNFVTYATKRLLIASFPFASDVEHLYRTYKVRAVVNMCAECRGPTEEYSRRRIAHLRLPTVDGSVPRVEDVKRALEFIEDRLEILKPDETILVHCKGGRGRAATVVMAYLMKHEAMTVEQAYEELHRKRPVLEPEVVRYKVFQDLLLSSR